MSCTHDCGCSAETRDARTDDWGHTSPLSPQNADLREFQPADASEALRDVPPAERPSEALPRPIDPEDVRVGMVVERRHGDMAHRDRVQQIDGGLIDGTVAYLWKPGHEERGWTLWLVEDAPEPVDPDAALVEVMAEAVWRSFVGPFSQWPDGPGSPSDSDDWRESSRAAIVAARAAGYRIEAAR